MSDSGFRWAIAGLIVGFPLCCLLAMCLAAVAARGDERQERVLNQRGLARARKAGAL